MAVRSKGLHRREREASAPGLPLLYHGWVLRPGVTECPAQPASRAFKQSFPTAVDIASQVGKAKKSTVARAGPEQAHGAEVHFKWG